jgi:hypothetical protein
MDETLMSVFVDVLTEEITERPLNAEEISERESIIATQETREAQRIAKEEARASGIAKLLALGLTEEEAGALING